MNKEDIVNSANLGGPTPDLIDFKSAAAPPSASLTPSAPATPPSAPATSYAPAAPSPVTAQLDGGKAQRKTVRQWSVDDVCGWLSSLGLSKYCSNFKGNDIDGEELLELDKEILERELKISKHLYYALSAILRYTD